MSIEQSSYNSVSRSQGKPFGGNRRVATVHARQAIMRSNLQEELGEKLGGFVWKVEMWPNWLSISVDKLGNDETETRGGSKVAQDWAEENQEQLQSMFSEVLGDKFGELSIMGRQMGPESPYGSCCRTGCAGCFNGPRDRLLDKVVQKSSAPVDCYEGKKTS